MAAPPDHGQDGRHIAISGSRRPHPGPLGLGQLGNQPALQITPASDPMPPSNAGSSSSAQGWDSMFGRHPQPYGAYPYPSAIKQEENVDHLAPHVYWPQAMTVEASSSSYLPSYPGSLPPSADVSFGTTDSTTSLLANGHLISLPGKRNVLKDGPNAGSVVRLALELVLSPSVGRAFVDLRDRRPLLPAAVIRLRCYASQPRTGAKPSQSVLPNLDDDALWDDIESTVDGLNISQLICSVALLQSATLPPSFDNYSFQPDQMPPPPPPITGLVNANSVPQPAEAETPSRSAKRAKLSSTPSPSESRRHSDLSSSSSRSGQVPRVKNLHGRVYVNARRITVPIDNGGDAQLGVWFTFPDICVKYEGRYHLHFRLFDISPAASSQPLSPPDPTTPTLATKPPVSPGSAGGCLCELISDPVDIVDAKSPMPNVPIHPLVEFLTR